MAATRILSFTDPHEYRACLRAVDEAVFPVARGEYLVELSQVRLHNLLMQRSRQTLAFVANSAAHKSQLTIAALSDADQPDLYFNGEKLGFGELVFMSPGAEWCYRTLGESRVVAFSLAPEQLADAGRAIIGRDLVFPKGTRRGRPAAHLMAWLFHLQSAAADFAASAPDAISHPEVAKAVEQALIQAMVACLADDDSKSAQRSCDYRGAIIMRRLERVLQTNTDRPLYLLELCQQIGVPARTLRHHCRHYLGMGPCHYLWLRRMHQTQRALSLADPTTATVTRIANDHGFGELGRFAVQYRELFGESPSMTLHRPPDAPTAGHAPSAMSLFA